MSTSSVCRLLRPVLRPAFALPVRPARPAPCRIQVGKQPFTSSAHRPTTLNQVLRGARKPQPTRKRTSPALVNRAQMQGVCLRVGITKPKKPNSGERKIARIRLSNGKHITAYIPGEGHNIQQHHVVMVRGGRAQDCPGVRYRCVRGVGDLAGVPNRVNGRSKYGTKKPKAA